MMMEINFGESRNRRVADHGSAKCALFYRQYRIQVDCRRIVGQPRKVCPPLLLAPVAKARGYFLPSDAMWQFLYFLPLPHQHGSLRPRFRFGDVDAAAAAACAGL